MVVMKNLGSLKVFILDLKNALTHSSGSSTPGFKNFKIKWNTKVLYYSILTADVNHVDFTTVIKMAFLKV
jgi:hypothetical protein